MCEGDFVSIRTFAAPLCAVSALTLASLALPAAPARADSIGGPDSTCVTCLGSLYTLTYTGSPVMTTATTKTWRVTLTIDTTDYTEKGTNRFIQAVSVSVGDPLVSGSLVSAPGTLADWADQAGDQNNVGCTGSGTAYYCAQAQAGSLTVAPADGSTHSWVFDLELANGDLATGPLAAAIKVNYINTVGAFRGQTNEDITLQVVPEPGTLVLVGLGGALLAARRPSFRPS
jgi:hypothetical protein